MPNNNRGCDYCADDNNMYFGHVAQIASNEDRRTLLLKCPHCGWLYETHPTGKPGAEHLSSTQAHE